MKGLSEMHKLILEDIHGLTEEILRNRWMSEVQFSILGTLLFHLSKDNLTRVIANRITILLPPLPEIVTCIEVALPITIDRDYATAKFRQLIGAIVLKAAATPTVEKPIDGSDLKS